MSEKDIIILITSVMEITQSFKTAYDFLLDFFKFKSLIFFA